MPTFTTRPTLTGTHGMVSSTHWLASQAAMRMLELDGNAADGAVAAGLVLQVVEPHLNGPGGDLPLIVASADDPVPRVLCGQGPAPAGATPEHFAAAGLDRVPTTIASVQELFEQDWTTSADTWLVDGAPPVPGSLLANQAWADTLERLVGEERAAGGTREQGIDAVRRAWSQGFVAQAV